MYKKMSFLNLCFFSMVTLDIVTLFIVVASQSGGQGGGGQKCSVGVENNCNS